MRSSRSGFTLIELLLTVGVISILLTLAIRSYTGVQKKARDLKRKSDLEQLRAALEQYRSEHGKYPYTSGLAESEPNPTARGLCTNFNPGGNTYDRSGANGYIPDLSPNYIPELPIDPRGDNKGGTYACPTSSQRPCYLYFANANQYKIVSYCGVESLNENTIQNDPYKDPKRLGAPPLNGNNEEFGLSFQVSSNNDARTRW